MRRLDSETARRLRAAGLVGAVVQTIGLVLMVCHDLRLGLFVAAAGAGLAAWAHERLGLRLRLREAIRAKLEHGTPIVDTVLERRQTERALRGR